MGNTRKPHFSLLDLPLQSVAGVAGRQRIRHVCRTTDAHVRKAAVDPIGPENDAYLWSLAKGAGVIVAAWGIKGIHMGRDAVIIKMIPDLHYLKLTQKGHPRHPLYLLKIETPKSWN